MPLLWFKQINTTQTNKILRENFGDVKSKTPDISGFPNTALLDAKIGEVKNKIPGVKGLVSTAVLNIKIREVENEIPVSRLWC